MNELLPCPHCGTDPRERRQQDESIFSHATVEYLQIVCDECGAKSESSEDHPAVVAAWNRRTQAATEGAVANVAKGRGAFFMQWTPLGSELPPGTYSLFLRPTSIESEPAIEASILRSALEKIAAIQNEAFGPDWKEIEKARVIANEALGRKLNEAGTHDRR